MAKQNRVQSTTIQFNVQGIQEIFGYQKKIKDAMKEIIAQKKKDLEQSGLIGAAYEKELNLIKQMENEMKRYGSTANNLQKVLENVGAASAKQLQQAEKALKNIRDGIKFDGKKMGVADAEKEVGLLNNTIQKVHKQFEAIQAEAHNATGFKVMGKSVQQLNDFVTNFERNAQYLTSQMQNGKQVFAEWGAKATEAKVRLGQLDGSLLAVNKSSNAETLRAYIKGWQEVAQYSGASSEQIKRANENIAKADALMRELMQKRIDRAGTTNFFGKDNYSPAQVREAVEYMKQLSTTEKLTTEEREKLNASIKRGDEYLKQLTLDQQRYSMTLQLGGKQMSNIKTLSDASLASQKKYWTEMVANTKQGTAEYNQYLATLKAVTDEEQRRASTKLRAEGGALVGQVNTGQFKGSIRETEEAIKKIQEYRRELSADTANGARNIETTEQALAKLNERLAQTKTEVINGKNSFDGLRSAAVQGVDAVVAKLPRGSEELKKMRSDLEAYKKSLKNPDPSKLQQIETIFTAIDKKEREVAASEISWSKFHGAELKKRSLVELKNAYEVLKKEVEGMSSAQQGYNEKAMQMRQIDKQIKNMNKSMGHHVSSLENAASRLKNYVMIYLGFNAVMMKTRQLISDVMKLSDQMVNVQKVTQMSNEEVERLVRNIQDLDTRTSTENLMAFAEQAGKLGIYTKNGLEGMKQFVEMGDRISKTLGEDIGGAQAIADLAKVNDIMNVTARTMERTGNEATVMRDALNATGSAILNVGNNSAASYGAIVEYVGRLGAISSASGIAMEETVALGGALDALKMPAESGSTALSQFINAVVRNTDAMAQAAKVSVVELRNLIQSGQTYKAVTLLFSKVADGTTTAQKLMDAMTGRSRTNVNIRNVIQLLSGHMELLNKQLEYAQSGFESAFSQKTANDVQLIMSAMKETIKIKEPWGDIIRDANSLTDIISIWQYGARDIGKDIPALAKRMSAAGYDVQMLESALRSVFSAMDRLDAEGRLTTETMEMLATSTGQASVMEQEFERVNESAAARFERLGRMMHEFFVNPESVKFWSDMSNGLMDFITWMQSGETGARMLGTALASLIAYLIAVKVRLHELIAVQLWGWFKNVGNAILNATTSTINFRRALVSLKNFLATNWITLAATAIAGLVYWLKSASDESMRFAKAAAEASEALADETKEAAMLFAQLKNTNSASAERARLIDLINSKYGLILKNMSDEVQFARQLETSYKLVVAQLREKSRLQLGETLFQNAKESAQNEQKKGAEGLNKVFEANKENVTAEQAGEFMGSVSALISAELVKNPKASVDEIFKAIEKKLPMIGIERDMTTAAGRQYSYATTMAKAGEEDIKRIIRGMQDEITINERTARFLNGYGAGDIEYSRQAAEGKVIETVTNLKGTFQKFNKNRKDVSDEELSNALEQLNFVLDNTTINQAAERDKNSAMYKNMKAFRGWVTQMSAEQTRRAGITPWGDSSTVGKAMEDWTTEALQAYHKKLSNTAIAAAPNADWSQIFPDIIGLKQGMTVQEVQKFVDEEDEKVQEILKSRHMGLTDFHHFKDKEGKKGQKEKDEFEAAIAELDRYYKDRETLIEIALNNEEITESEANRRKESLEAEHLSKRSQLRRDAINKMDDGEMKEFENWWDSVEELDKVNFKRLREQSDLWGKAYVQKVALAASKDLSEIEKMLQEHKKKIDKILEDGDDVRKVTDAFKAAMDDLDMIFAIREDEAKRTAELGNRRLTQLMEWSKKAYSISVDDLKREMEEIGNVYHDWFVALGDDQDRTLQAMLVRLRQYTDDMEEVVRKAAKERKRLFDMVYNNVVGDNGVTRKQTETAALDQARSRVEGMQRAQGWGFGGDNLTNNAELNLINLQIRQKLEYIEALKTQLQYETALNKEAEKEIERQIDRAKANPALNGEGYSIEEQAQAAQELADLENQLAQKRQDTANLELETNVLLADSETELTELRKEQMNEALEHYDRMFNYLQEMQGNMDSFAESFGEGIFGSKEDRAQAAKDLLTDVLKTTKNVAQAYMIEIATKKVADQAIVAMEQQKQAQLQAQQAQALGMYGATKVAEMTVEGATTTAKVTADTAKGIGTEVAKHGLKGLAIGAAISAALSLLLGLAMGAINKSKSAIASATGATSAGKLATGMLTYGKGRYPVYADGVYADDGSGRVQGQLVSVRGNDGVNYMAKYQPNLQTGVVNSPHLGIVGEKGAELIVDHGTYEDLKRYDPETLRRIYAMKQYGMRSIDFSRTSRMGNEVLMNRGGVRAYADGNIESMLGDMGMNENGGNDGTVTQMQQTLAELTMVLGAIKATGIPATMSYLGANGAQKQMEKGDKFLQRVGLKK